MSKNLVTLVALHTDNRLINRFENNSCKSFFTRIVCGVQNLIRDG